MKPCIYTGENFTQRNSCYYDWRRKEIRLIDVYRFDEIPKKHVAQKTFRKQKKIPSGSQIEYTLSGNHLVKVKITPSKKQCLPCDAEYYFVNDQLIDQNEPHFNQQVNNFTNDATFFLTRLERLQIIRKSSNDLLTNQ